VPVPAGFFLSNGRESALVLLGAAKTLTAAGAGAWSIDVPHRDRRLAEQQDPGTAGVPPRPGTRSVDGGVEGSSI
jgi:hypothetical protein